MQSLLIGECVLRGDMAAIKIGRNCIIDDGALLKPPYKKATSTAPPMFLPMTISEHVYVGRNAKVMAQSVAPHVHIGHNAIIGRRATLSECAYIDDDAVIAPDTIVPSFAIMRGNPGITSPHV